MVVQVEATVLTEGIILPGKKGIRYSKSKLANNSWQLAKNCIYLHLSLFIQKVSWQMAMSSWQKNAIFFILNSYFVTLS